jgi:hypothetical protein
MYTQCGRIAYMQYKRNGIWWDKNRVDELGHVTRIIRNNETRNDHVKFKQVVEPWAQRVAIRV